jgi:uncharacterized membrane protein
MKIIGLSFVLHLIGITVWIGSSFLLPLAIVPAVRKLEPGAQALFLRVFRKRFLPLFIGSGLLVGLTGLYQTVTMDKDLNIPAIYTKHIVILLLIAVSSYIWFFLSGKQIMSLPAGGKWGRFALFSWIQAALGVIVLICTGWLTQ